MKATKEHARASIQAITALAELIRELGSVPSGYLYARVMSYMSLETYNSFIGHLVNAGLVREAPSHLLTWIGPTKEESPAKEEDGLGAFREGGAEDYYVWKERQRRYDRADREDQ